MKSDILNARDCGVTPGLRLDNTNRVALQRAADEMRCAGGRTIYVTWGACGFAGTTAEISTAASAAGTLRIHGEGSATAVQSVGSNLFVLTGAQNNSSSGEVLLEELAFQERSSPRLKGGAPTDALIAKEPEKPLRLSQDQKEIL